VNSSPSAAAALASVELDWQPHDWGGGGDD
jgi:hypothetical protein